MKKIAYMFMISIFALFLSTITLATKAATTNPPTTVYIYPASITATEVNQEFTIEIRVNKVTDLYGWDIGLTWNATALECLNFTEGTFLTSSGYSTLGVDGTINNTAGEIYPFYGRALMGALVGVNGSSTDPGKGALATASFKAKAVGTFNIHLAETQLWDSYALGIPFNRVDFFTVTYEQAYLVVTESNLTGLAPEPYRYRIVNHAFSQPAMQITFNVFIPPPPYATGTPFCNVTIPKPLLRDNATDPWHVYLNTTANEIGYTEAENATHSALYFTFPIGNHKIIIQGAEVIPFTKFSLVTLYVVHLEVNGTFLDGSKLLIMFYDYSGSYEANVTVWTGVTPDNIIVSENYTHPLGLPVENATLVATDDLGNIMQTVTSFVVCRSDLISRLGELDYLWTIPGADRTAIMKEYVAIDGQWPYAPP